MARIEFWLDDERPRPHHSMNRFLSAKNLIKYIAWMMEVSKSTNHEIVLDLDHDLGDEGVVGNGYDVILWVEEMVATGKWKFDSRPVIRVHTANASARLKMLAGVESINRLWADRV